jgi:predicted O-methyltransferase YrrM
MAWLMLIGGAMDAEPAKKTAAPPDDPKAQAVIDEVEKICLEGPVYMIGRKRAERLAELVRKAKPRRVVECGTALGYSGLWIARELKAAGKGKLITIELNPERAKQARANFRKAGLQKYVTVKVGDARKVVRQIKGPIDFVFIDCGYSNYYPCLKGLQKEISGGATIVADNVGVGAGGMKDYLKEVRSKYKSHTEWFDVNLPWGKRDAMEISVVPKKAVAKKRVGPAAKP